MLRLVYVILVSFPLVLYYLLKSRYVSKHMDSYSEQERYNMVRRMIAIMKHNGRIQTEVYGTDNLPEDGGYVMYPNHQGKYDALGIINAHEKPCTFLIDEGRSEMPFANEVSSLLEACKLNKGDLRQQVKTIFEVIRQVEHGRRYIVFPEGGYTDNRNLLQEFKPGAFKCSIRSKTPIIPVALVDSYKVFGVNSLRKIRTEVHFLKPLYYEEYQNLTSAQIAELVKERIQSVLANRTHCIG